MQKKRVNLALQGGGAHGAFTWGVLDRFLEEDMFEVNGVSGTSAGAVNGVCLVYGLATGGKEKAKDLLASFWHKCSEIAKFSPLQPTPFDSALGPGNMDYNPFYIILNIFSSIVPPYIWNPCNYNVVKDVLNELIDFTTIQKCTEYILFLAATNIKSNKIKIFSNPEITVDSVLASTCLPNMFQAVKIDDEFYWDGGFMGNPAIFPLFANTDTNDLMIIQIYTANYGRVPFTSSDILHRATDLSFNSTLMREMRAIHFVNDLVDRGVNDNGKLKKIYVHHISSGELMENFNMSSQLNVTLKWLTYLRDYGRKVADAWIKDNYNKIGKETTCEWCQFI